jgi:chemotaxis protein methyltransferase CheR
MVLDFYSRGRCLGGGGDKGNNRNAGDNEMSFAFEIDAFDINPDMIEIARAGRYTANAFRQDGAGWKFLSDLYLSGDGQGYRVSELLRRRVNFSVHNVMDGLCGMYDIIFFRNALIYFSPESRGGIFSTMAGALHEGGVFIPGVSETPSVEHPLLESRQLMDTFYFKKRTPASQAEKPLEIRAVRAAAAPAPVPASALMGGSMSAAAVHADRAAVTQARERPETEIKPAPGSTFTSISASGKTLQAEPSPRMAKAPGKRSGGSPPPEARVVEALLEGEDGLAEKVLGRLRRTGAEESGGPPEPSVNELAAAAIAFLGAENTEAADTVLAALEKKSGGAAAAFLRAEYYYHRGEPGAAETRYQEAADRDKAFWPAFYRLSLLAAGSNPTRGAYKSRKALESIEKGGGLHYEIFIGGFSPDYYRRILERKAAGGN